MSKRKEEQAKESVPDQEVSSTGESEVEKEKEEITEVEVGEENGEESVETDIEDLEAEIADLNDQILRKQADFENFRKRMFREREEAAKFSNSKLLLDLVEIIDNFERAIKSSEESQDFQSFHEGIELIEKQFIGMLESKWGLKRFESEGEPFDPEKHEAIAVDQSGDYPEQSVVEDFQKGYMLHDRVLRNAKVKVALPVSDQPQAETGDTDEQTE
jgi:molecular chaperone GrpE